MYDLVAIPPDTHVRYPHARITDGIQEYEIFIVETTVDSTTHPLARSDQCTIYIREVGTIGWTFLPDDHQAIRQIGRIWYDVFQDSVTLQSYFDRVLGVRG